MDKRIDDALGVLTSTLLQRGSDRDDPFRVLINTANKEDCEVQDVCRFLINLKIARIENDISVQDSWLDVAGYAILAYAFGLEETFE